MQSFIIALNAVTPFLCYIMFGYFAKRMGWGSETFMKKMNQLVFKSFYPFMMFYNMYTKDRDVQFDMKLIMTGVATLVVLLVLLFLIVPRMVKDRKKVGVIIQSLYRSNTVLYAIPLMESMYGKKGVSVATILVAIMVPIFNVLAVIILEYYGSESNKTSVRDMIKSILTNPIIDGAVVGFIFYVFRIPIPAALMKPISQFAALTTPLALFILGGTLRFKSMLKHKKYIIPDILVKSFVIPAMMMIIAFALHFGPIERFAIFCIYGTPVAAASYTMAESMGCDGELAAELVVAGTTFSVISIFLWIYMLGSFGLLV